MVTVAFQNATYDLLEAQKKLRMLVTFPESPHIVDEPKHCLSITDYDEYLHCSQYSSL